MNRIKLFLFSFAFFVFSCAVFFAYLENGSNNYFCEAGSRDIQIKVCNTNYYPVNGKKVKILNELIEQKAAGINPDRTELMSAVIFAPYEDMPGLNGVFCNNNIIVRSDLGEEGKSFVARHELDHVFQWAYVGNDCTRSEFCATMNAAMEYPSGFIETIISSLIVSYKETPDKQCFLFTSWKIFRVYILP